MLTLRGRLNLRFSRLLIYQRVEYISKHNPSPYFLAFFRGYFDGDGSVGTHKHPESQHLQLRVRFSSASRLFLLWLKQEIQKSCNISGGWIMNTRRAYQLTYGKKDAIKLLKFLYDDDKLCSLKRKHTIAEDYLS